jgi:hypothetical protein
VLPKHYCFRINIGRSSIRAVVTVQMRNQQGISHNLQSSCANDNSISRACVHSDGYIIQGPRQDLLAIMYHREGMCSAARLKRCGLAAVDRRWSDEIVLTIFDADSAQATLDVHIAKMRNASGLVPGGSHRSAAAHSAIFATRCGCSRCRRICTERT